MRKLEAGVFLGEADGVFHQEGVIVSKAVYRRPPAYQGWHCHEHHHLTVVVKGGNVEHRSVKEKEVLAGQVLFYHSGESHKNSHTQCPSVNINLEIPDSFLTHYGLSFSAVNRFPEQLEQMKYAVLKAYQACKLGDAALIPSLLLPGFTAPLVRKTETPPWVLQLKMLLNDRWNETLSLQEMSVILGIHPVTISRYFPVYFNCSLGEYMRKIKIDRAMVMVHTQEASLTDIAYSCGFFDQSHFIRTFKSVTGFLPRRFQQI
ncbi:helix-turn-helix transcriptional regulator [Chitinophaga polysaccharea]|uniref:helix-turn-helix domain-containing protein n=1 Tax=Chitinophaga polysaccharea TaxID=1293035 RepID=UPI001454F744|nr:AraC family transcriptional regulator [Chitinophaga polysaccharea]NLR58415.1 helix-turn-helix transcriptional regulator [Chitinophaga polysaccharea]